MLAAIETACPRTSAQGSAQSQAEQVKWRTVHQNFSLHLHKKEKRWFQTWQAEQARPNMRLLRLQDVQYNFTRGSVWGTLPNCPVPALCERSNLGVPDVRQPDVWLPVSARHICGCAKGNFRRSRVVPGLDVKVKLNTSMQHHPTFISSYMIDMQFTYVDLDLEIDR